MLVHLNILQEKKIIKIMGKRSKGIHRKRQRHSITGRNIFFIVTRKRKK